jgi:hypothetical protein
MASDTYSAKGGAVAAVVNASWAQARSAPSVLDWLPRPETPLYPGGPIMNVVWYRFFRTLAEKVGGIKGLSSTELQASIAAVQDQTLQAASSAQAAASLAAANTASIDVIREVAQNAGLPGSGQIP